MNRALAVLLLAVCAVLVGCGAPPDATLPVGPPVVASVEPTPPAVLTPTRVRIPTLGVDSTLIPTGLDAAGELIVPSSAGQAAWYGGSPTPGDVGPAVLIGHVDLDGQDGVFARLPELVADDVVVVDRSSGQSVEFAVTRVERHPKAAFPSAAVYGDTNGPELRLITCGGVFDRGSGHYRDNVIVWARQLPPPL